MKNEKRIFEVSKNGDIWILYKLKSEKSKKTYFSKSHAKRYSNGSRRVDKMDLKVIANDFKNTFKKSKNLKDFYMYLVYKNVYGDFFPKKCEVEQMQKMAIDSLCITNKNCKLQNLKKVS